MNEEGSGKALHKRKLGLRRVGTRGPHRPPYLKLNEKVAKLEFPRYRIFANTPRMLANNIRSYSRKKFEYRKYIRVNIRRYYFKYIRDYRLNIQQNPIIITLFLYGNGFF